MARPRRKDHVVRLALALLLVSAPALAQDRDEDLALRLIFDHCLPYASQGTAPFDGIAEPAPDDATLRALAPSFPASSHALRLIGPDYEGRPYLAFWGSENARRFCAVVEAAEDAPDGLRITLDFFDHLNAKARSAGLTLDMDHSAYARRDLRWRLPEHAENPFNGLILSISLGPTGSQTEHVQALGASAPELMAN